MPLEDRHIVLGVTGSISAYKAVEVARGLLKAGAELRVIMTAAATEFVGPTTFSAITGHRVRLDQFDDGGGPGEAHIDLAAWADVLAVVPATGNIIGKAANGLADDMLSTTLLACEAPCCFAPAMNFRMMRNCAVVANLDTLRSRGVHIIDAEFGPLANGEVGDGRLAEPYHIIEAIAELSEQRKDLAGKRVLVSAGPTEEPLDPLRYLTNRSSGKMGYAVAIAAARRGAEVTLVSGPTTIEKPRSVNLVHVRTADEMCAAVVERAESQDAVIMAAAVADYRPLSAADHKLKKGADTLTLEMEKTADILKTLGAARPPVLIGFAVETRNGLEYARGKLAEKDLDLIVYNDITADGAGFGVDTNVVTFIQRDGRSQEYPLQLKAEVADNLITEVAALLKSRQAVAT